MSRFPVSAAVSRLAFESLVVIEPQHGSFVARISAADVRERMFIRRALEGEIAAEAARRLPRDGLAALEENLAREREAVEAGDRVSFYTHDVGFHQALTTHLGLRRSAEILDNVRAHLERVRRMLMLPPGRISGTLAEHTAIFEAIAAGDADGGARRDVATSRRDDRAIRVVRPRAARADFGLRRSGDDPDQFHVMAGLDPAIQVATPAYGTVAAHFRSPGDTIWMAGSSPAMTVVGRPIQGREFMSAPRALRLHAQDNVMVAVDEIRPGDAPVGAPAAIERVPRGHKMATAPIAEGEPVRKFGQIIGFASTAIAPGQWVHDHNCAVGQFERDYGFCADARPVNVLPIEEQATFQGFRRAGGKAGTRNYLGILTSVNCSATVARYVAREVEKSGVLADYPNVDGVIALVHGTGCGMAGKGEGFEVLAPHAMGLRRQSQHGRRGDDRPRLRGVPDRPDEGGAPSRGERPLQHPDDPGDRRHAQVDRGGRSSGSRRCCRSSTPPSARRCRRAS